MVFIKVTSATAKSGFIFFTGATKEKLKAQVGIDFNKFQDKFQDSLKRQLKIQGREIIKYLLENVITNEQRRSPSGGEGFLYRATGKLRDSLQTDVQLERGMQKYSLKIVSTARQGSELAKYVNMHIDPKRTSTTIRPRSRKFLAVPTPRLIQNHRLPSGKIPSPSEAGVPFKFVYRHWITKQPTRAGTSAIAYLLFKKATHKQQYKLKPDDFAYTLHKKITVPRKVNLVEATRDAALRVGVEKNIRNARAKLRRNLIKSFKKG